MQDQFLALATSTVIKVYIYLIKNTEILCCKQEKLIKEK
jgi:hypothetical protein